MLEKSNSIWKNLLFDVIVGLTLVGLIIYNFYEKGNNELDFTTSHKISIGLYFFLALHGLFLLILTIKNVIGKKFVKAVVFFLTSIGLFTGLYFIAIFLFISTMGGPPVDEGNRHNFRQSNLCKKIDSNEIKTTVENFRKGIFPSILDSSFIQDILGDTISQPRQITKIECGCRMTDTTVIIIRIWDIDENTFELELSNNNGQWKYERIYYEYFD